MGALVLLIVLAAAAWFAWKSWDPTTKTFDFKHGAAALVAILVAVWEWVNGTILSLLG